MDRRVEALDVVKHIDSGFIARRVGSVLSDEKKLSIAALSHTLPDRLIDQTTPLSAVSRWNCSPVYWLPRSDAAVHRACRDARSPSEFGTIHAFTAPLHGVVTCQSPARVQAAEETRPCLEGNYSWAPPELTGYPGRSC